MVAKIEQIFLVGKNPWKNWSCHTIFADFRRAVWRVRSWILVKFLTGKVLVPAAAAGAGAGAAGASKIFAQNFKSENKTNIRLRVIFYIDIFVFVLHV